LELAGTITTGDDGDMSVEPVILCPLEVEARWLHAAAPSLPRPVVVGPGDGVRHWIATHGRSGMVAILCGLAGGLRPTTPVGSAFLVDRVASGVDADGELNADQPTTLRAAIGVSELATVERASVVTIRRVVGDPTTRTALSAAHPDAQLVDCESWWFARACHSAGVSWWIVRGVSDGPDDRLPRDVDDWVDADGSNRIGRVLSSLLRRPLDVVLLPRLARRGRRAMAAVAGVLESNWADMEKGPA